MADSPENYHTVTRRLTAKGDATTLELTQENCPGRESADHSAANWNTVLGKLKELLEKPAAC